VLLAVFSAVSPAATSATLEFETQEFDLETGRSNNSMTRSRCGDAFEDSAGKTVLRYGELPAWDGGGKELPISLDSYQGGYALRVDDCRAVYPITIDPVVTNETAKIDDTDAGDGLVYDNNSSEVVQGGSIKIHAN